MTDTSLLKTYERLFAPAWDRCSIGCNPAALPRTTGKKMASPEAGLWKVWERMPERHVPYADHRACSQVQNEGV
jgi:hypothetical protein